MCAKFYYYDFNEFIFEWSKTIMIGPKRLSYKNDQFSQLKYRILFSKKSMKHNYTSNSKYAYKWRFFLICMFPESLYSWSCILPSICGGKTKYYPIVKYKLTHPRKEKEQEKKKNHFISYKFSINFIKRTQSYSRKKWKYSKSWKVVDVLSSSVLIIFLSFFLLSTFNAYWWENHLSVSRCSCRKAE